MALDPRTRWLLGGGLLLLAAAVGWFSRRQARPERARIGGALSPPKQVWLFLALGTWFVAAPLLALDPAVSRPWRALLGAFALLMLIRAPLELVLLYGLRRWTPPMGIAHDLVCLVGVAGGLPLVLARAAWPPGGADRAAGLLALGLLLTLAIEVHHAWVFWRVVGSLGTQGQDAVWFAAPDDPRFARINRVTAWLNVPAAAALGAVVLASLTA